MLLKLEKFYENCQSVYFNFLNLLRFLLLSIIKTNEIFFARPELILVCLLLGQKDERKEGKICMIFEAY